MFSFVLYLCFQLGNRQHDSSGNSFFKDNIFCLSGGVWAVLGWHTSIPAAQVSMEIHFSCCFLEKQTSDILKSKGQTSPTLDLPFHQKLMVLTVSFRKQTKISKMDVFGKPAVPLGWETLKGIPCNSDKHSTTTCRSHQLRGLCWECLKTAGSQGHPRSRAARAPSPLPAQALCPPWGRWGRAGRGSSSSSG